MRPYARVALLAEGVDRNELAKVIRAGLHDVALLAEGVDRNSMVGSPFLSVYAVALLAEGVDRNFAQRLCERLERKSPSSRRAWIEIPIQR